jgi:hypothetical protein
MRWLSPVWSLVGQFFRRAARPRIAFVTQADEDARLVAIEEKVRGESGPPVPVRHFDRTVRSLP